MPTIRDRRTGEEKYYEEVQIKDGKVLCKKGFGPLGILKEHHTYSLDNVDVEDIGCFVATASGADREQLEVLRKYRDEVLMKGPSGFLGVCAYYIFSPMAAAIIKSDKELKRIIKEGLVKKVVAHARKKLDAMQRH